MIGKQRQQEERVVSGCALLGKKMSFFFQFFSSPFSSAIEEFSFFGSKSRVSAQIRCNE
jgi:hypothetical protein